MRGRKVPEPRAERPVQKTGRRSRRIAAIILAGCLSCCTLLMCSRSFAVPPGQSLELSRPIRPWEFISATGTRAALLGNEQGTLEAWVYPLKILANFHLRFHVDGVAQPAETLARTLIVRPESTTIIYVGDNFSVRETLFVPVHEPGAIIAFEVDTTKHLEIEAVFLRDFQLEWPGNIGDTNEGWDPGLHAFHFADEAGKFEALVGSPSASVTSEEYASNYFYSRDNSFLLGPTEKGVDTKIIAIAASFTGHAALATLYDRLSKDYLALRSDSAAYYREYLSNTVNVHLPDAQIESAYDWARVSMLQGVVDNPFLGKGLVAGFDTSRGDYRPGFDWFFGRDAEWTSFALDAAGDFLNARSALEFLSKYQRSDGRITHEISQSADFLAWFKTEFAYASADSTPLFIIAVNDYVKRSGDIEFARQHWDNLWRAYGFLQSTYDAQGFAKNVGVGHGWIEGGPLYPVQTEIYQASLGVEALGGLSHMASLLGKEDIAHQLAEAHDRQRPLLDKTFWSPDKNMCAYARDLHGNRVDVASVLTAVPMWFRQLDSDHAEKMIQTLAEPDHQADWGMRIVSSRDSKYDPGGYHFGTVWPLFTGWASVAEYRYHRPFPAYTNLRANALLVSDGSLGHVAEVLSGKYYQTLATGSPHQIWSAAMVVNPLLSGLLGIETDAATCHLVFAPHVPADWSSFSVDHLRVGAETVSFDYQRTPDNIRLEVQSTGAEPGAKPSAKRCSLEFSPAVSLRARIKQVRFNGRAQQFHLEANSSDQHISMELPIGGTDNIVQISMERNFELSWSSTLPPLGDTSHGLRVLSESWTPAKDTLTLLLSGAAGQSYDFWAWNARQVSSIEGAQLDSTAERAAERYSDPAKVHVQLPMSVPDADPKATVIFHFTRAATK
jgi:glycogen debranching enzyme